MRTGDTHDWRAPIFLIVLLFHGVVVLLATRSVRQGLFSSNSSYEPFVLLLLNEQAPAAADTATHQHGPISWRPPASVARTAKRKSAESENAITLPSKVEPQPKIDWTHAAEIAAQNEVARAEKEGHYRDLSALSPEQLSWIKQNHLEPVPRGIPWNHPRVEIENGLPIIWINDHCVAIPVMMMAVFCIIGHIEARSDLFEHMHDQRDP